MSIEQAEQLLQRAYNGEDIRLPDDLIAAGIMDTHKVYYDGQLAALAEIKEILSDPGHPLTKVITTLRDMRLSEGHYSKETLDTMYGLKKGKE